MTMTPKFWLVCATFALTATFLYVLGSYMTAHLVR